MIVCSGRKSRSLSFSFQDFITVGCASVPLSDSVKNFGVTIDCHLTMKTHVSNLVRSANFEFSRISSIRNLLTTDATQTLVSAFVLSHLDYCNSVLLGCLQYLLPCSGELRMQKLKSHLVRTQSLNVLPFKPGVGQYIAIHAMLIAGEFFLAYFYPSSPFTCIFSKTSPNFFPVLACRIK